jgi:hypothetical protein
MGLMTEISSLYLAWWLTLLVTGPTEKGPFSPYISDGANWTSLRSAIIWKNLKTMDQAQNNDPIYSNIPGPG